MFDNADVIFSSLLSAAPFTLIATGAGIALTVVLSFAAGMALLSRSRTVRFISRVYVEGLRGSSEVVQLFWVAFALPQLLGYQIVPLFAGILVLGLNHGAYGAEIVRGAVRSVPAAQVEGAVALGFSPAQRMRRVVLPQAVVEMLPSFNNLFIQLMKATALLSFIGVLELTQQGKLLVPSFGAGSGIVVIFGLQLLMYLAIALVITAVMRWLERVGARKLGRTAISPTRALATAEAAR